LRTLVATRDPSAVDAELVALVGELSRRAGRPVLEHEVRAALAPLSPAQEAVLRATSSREPPAAPLGPMAWVDIARGVAPQAAAARELSGYYTLLAERDALASMLEARSIPPPPAAGPPTAPPPGLSGPPSRSPPPPFAAAEPPTSRSPPAQLPLAEQASPPTTRPRAVKAPVASRKSIKKAPGRAEQILGLFAYHRDAPRVARALSLSMAELDSEIEALKIRRKASRLVNGRDVDLPRAVTLPGASGPSVRRRSVRLTKAEGAAAPRARTGAADPAPAAVTATPAAQAEREAAVATQSARLRAVLREVGPRRAALAAKLGERGKPLPDSVLLARFRAAGLEREFGQRERDLIRALLSRHRMAVDPAARELQLSPDGLRALVKERGLAREVEAQREKERAKLRSRNAPRDRVDQVLRQREWLSDLGILAELDAEAKDLVGSALAKARSEGLRGENAAQALRRELKVSLADVRALLSLYTLR
jgi:hypothetical protein